MKRSILSIAATFLLTVATAQDDVVIYNYGTTTDVSSGQGVVNVVPPSLEVFDVNLVVENNTGSTQFWRVARKRIDTPIGWSDGLCWGHCTDPIGGTCYSSSQMANSSWVSTDAAAFELLDTECGKLKPQIDPDDFVSGVAHYRYYLLPKVGQGTGYVDSVDVIVDWTAAIKQVKEEPTINVQPNPASEHVFVTLNNAEQATMKIVDVLGNVVLKETISGTKKIDVSNFRSGAYFIMIETSTGRSLNRKLIVRH